MNYKKSLNLDRYMRCFATLLLLLFTVFNVSASEDTVYIEMQDLIIENGEEFTIDVKISGFENVVGAQFTVNYDKNVLNYLDVDNFAIASINENNNFGIPQPENGTISFLWYDFLAQGVTIDDESTLFRMRFIGVGSMGDCSHIDLDTSSTILNVIEFSNTAGEIMPVVVTKGNVCIGTVNNIDLDINDFTIGNFNPSVVGDQSTLTIESPVNQRINYTMLDLTGKVVSSGMTDLVSGTNNIVFDRSKLPNKAGTYFVEFKIGNYKIARKFIKM